MTLKNSFLYVLLYLLPKNAVSCMMGWLVSMPLPKKLALFVNRGFAKTFGINLDEAALPITNFACLQDFFIRHLKPGLRPISSETDVLVSPCDGSLSQCAPIIGGQLIQAKGKLYGVQELVGDKELAARFIGGSYATLYLSPRDYHRFHVPLDGEIIKTIYVPGTLWPVNAWAVNNVKNLFCQNERVITLIREKQTQRLLAHIAVGATMVGKISLEYFAFNNVKTPCRRTQIFEHNLSVKKGDDLGKFMFGSTIVLLAEPGLLDGMAKDTPRSVKMGEILGTLAKS